MIAEEPKAPGRRLLKTNQAVFMRRKEGGSDAITRWPLSVDRARSVAGRLFCHRPVPKQEPGCRQRRRLRPGLAGVPLRRCGERPCGRATMVAPPGLRGRRRGVSFGDAARRGVGIELVAE